MSVHPFPDHRCALGAAVTLLVGGLASTAAAGDRLVEALSGGEPTVDLRYRYEEVDDDARTVDAEASTVRLRLGYTTGRFHGWQVHADLEHISVVGAERFNDTANGLTDYPVVADPPGTELNQIFVGYDGLPNTEVRLGRQRIKLDNDRFIGNVGWRQNEQTYDALTVDARPTERLRVFYARVNNVNRIFGEYHPDPMRADVNLGGDLLNVRVQWKPGALSGYAYLLELDDAPASSQQTFGLRFTGQTPLRGDVGLMYLAEYADQSDYRDGDDTIDADYLRIEAGIDTSPVDFRIGFERLGGDGNYGLSTPFATLHAHNGWVDRFLATPATGLEDLYLAVSAKPGGFDLRAVYHELSADAGGASYGDEIDASFGRTFRDTYSLLVKYGVYRADTFSVDAHKLWLQLGLKL